MRRLTYGEDHPQAGPLVKPNNKVLIPTNKSRCADPVNGFQSAVALKRGQNQGCQQSGDHSNRDIDEKNRVPPKVGDQKTTQGGTQGRSAADNDALDSHGDAASPCRKGIGDVCQGIAGNQGTPYGLYQPGSDQP